MCLCRSEKTQFRNELKSSINAGRYTADYLLCGDLPYPAWKMRIPAHLSYKCIRRYLVWRLKRLEARDFSHVRIEFLIHEDVDFDTFSKSDFRAVKVKECVAVPKSKKLLQFTLDDGTGTDRTILSGIHAYYEPEELVGKTLIAITNLPPRKMMGIESCGMLLSAVNNLKDSEDEELHLIMVDNHIPAGAKLY